MTDQEFCDRVKDLVFEELNYLRSLRGNSFHDPQDFKRKTMTGLIDDEERVIEAAASLGMGEMTFLPSSRYGPKY